MAMPRATILAGGSWSIRSPSNQTSPWLGLFSPVIARKVVVLPAPLEPISATTWPCSSRIDTSRRALTLS